MAIRYDKKFNAEIRRSVDLVNKKFARARKAGYTKVPKNISIRDLKKEFKSKYATRAEFRRRLNEYQKVNIGDLSKVVELETGSRVSLQSLKMTEKRRLRLLRKVRRDIKESESRMEKAKTKNLPFNRDEIERLKNIESKLAQSARSSESRFRMINEMYSREYSSQKKDSFERSFLDTMEEHLKRVQLDDDPAKDEEMKNAIRNRLGGAKIDTLIKMNREDEDVAEILDRYKGKDEYVEEDLEPIKQAYKNIYEKLDRLEDIYGA